MLCESDILPFSTSQLPKGPWLIFSPHPDDETFGMGGTILRAKKQAIDVSLVTVTNGQLGGDNDSGQLVKIRQKELNAAAQLLGITKLYSLNLNDRAVCVTDKSILKIQEIIEKVSPGSIFFPSILEPHPDHRATAKLVSCSVTDKMQEILFFGYDITVQNPINKLIDISEVHKQKVAAMNLYQSQLEQNNYIDIINSINKSRAYTLGLEVDYAEGFFYYKDFISLPFSDQVYQQLKPFWQSQQKNIKKTVSVIIRTYNREQQLKEALESLSQQTYPNIEVIVVNDGGNDVRKVVENFKKQFLTTIYCPLERNQGRSAAANYGLKHVSGDYVLFLDDDDYVLADHLSVLVKHLLDNPQYKAAYTETKVESPDGDFIMSDPYDISILRSNNFLPIHSVLFQSDLLEHVSFDTSLSVYEDWDFWLQIAEHSNFLQIKDHPSAIYRAMGDSGVGVIATTTKQRLEKLKIIKKWSGLWSSEDLLDIFYAMENKKNRDLSEHQAVIQENARRMNTQSVEITSLKSDIQKLNSINNNLSRANDDLNGANNVLSQDNEKINQINNNLSQDNNTLNQINNDLSEDNEKINQINNNLSQDNNTLNQINNDLSEDNEKINQINNNLSQDNNTLNQINNDLSEDNEKINQINNNLSQDNNTLNQINTNLNEDNGKLNSIVNEKEKLNQILQDELKLLYNSLSWKVSKPLRFIKRKLIE